MPTMKLFKWVEVSTEDARGNWHVNGYYENMDLAKKADHQGWYGSRPKYRRVRVASMANGKGYFLLTRVGRNRGKHHHYM